MIPACLEYLFLLLLLFLLTLSALLDELKRVARQKPFWCSLLIYLLACTLLDYSAITLGWWTFSERKISGLLVLGIPVEEFLLFVVIFLMTVGFWEILSHDVA